MLRARKKAKLDGDYLYIGNIYAKFRGAQSTEYDAKQTEAKGEPIVQDRMITWYAKQILRPTVKAVVLVAFVAMFGICAWKTTLMKQEFHVEDYVPDDSFTKTFFASRKLYLLASFAALREFTHSCPCCLRAPQSPTSRASRWK